MTAETALFSSAHDVHAGAFLTTTVLIVRHAESAANEGAYFAGHSDSPLTPRGREDADALAVALAKTPIDAIYASDLSRARDTAAPIARSHGLPLIELAELRERHMGVLTGVRFAEAKARFPDLWSRMVARDPEAAPIDGETHHALAQRMNELAATLLARHRGGALLVVSHGVAVHHLIRVLLGINDPAHPLWLSVDNASISRIDLVEVATDRVVPKLTYFNRPHRPQAL